MKIKYQIVLDVTADGVEGPALLLQSIKEAVLNFATNRNTLTPSYPVELGKVRIASSYVIHE